MLTDPNNTLPLYPGQRWPFEHMDFNPAYPATAFNAALEKNTISFEDVAVGMMIETLEDELVQAARQTWMTVTKRLAVLLLVDRHCVAATFRNFEQSGVQITVKCYSGSPYPRDQNALKGQALWNELFKLPRRKFYLKLDTDSMLEPSLLLRFINFLHRDVRPKLPQLPIMYFGKSGGWPIAFRTLSDQPWYQNLTITITSELHRLSVPNPAFSPLSRRGESNAYLPYVQGGLIGVSYGALQMIVRTQCIERIANIVPWNQRGIHQPIYMEDFNLGICMHIFGAPTITTPCVHERPHCKCAATNSNAKCREDFWHPEQCLKSAVSIHRLKNATDYHRCWIWQQEQLQPHRQTFLKPFSKAA